MSDKQGTSKGGKDGAAPPLDRRVLTLAGWHANPIADMHPGQ
jgi:hypothetical protein